MNSTANPAAIIAHKILRQQARRQENLQALLASSPNRLHARSVADVATKISEIEGKIEGLIEALEVVLDRDVTQADSEEMGR